MKTSEHDLIILGAGPGGYVAAIRAAQLGLNVACVEKESALGGTCLRVGCIPSKALLESSEQFVNAKESLASHGVRLGSVKLDLGTMLKRKEQIVSTLAKGVDGLLKKNQITRVQGHGRLDGPGRVVVENGKEQVALTARRILIATGSKSKPLKGVELDGDRIGTSTEALSYPSVPKHLVVIGAGYIGLELGSVWQRLGARVTVLEFLDRILPGMDSEIAAEAKKVFEKQGLEFRLGAKVTSAKVKGKQCIVEVAGAKPLSCDRVLLSVGRVPNTDNLGLDTVGLELDKLGRIPVDEQFRTRAEGVFAIGDVIPGPMLAHKAEEEGVACVEMMVTGHGHVDYNAIPGVVYTQPEIGTVGRSEDELKEQGIEYRKGIFHFRASGRAQALGHTEGKVKVLADAKTDRLLGVHIIGRHAGDLINEAAVAIAFGASSEDLARTCHAHPTLAESLREAALAVDGRALHA
jgi:dihydrolipoamide dehydrogenase